MDTDRIRIAYFTMEVGINANINTYSGGLGILAGDMLRSCADLELPVVGISLLYKKGFFKQKIENGEQREEEQNWDPSQFMEKLSNKAIIKIGDQDVHIGCWLYKFKGVYGKENPLIFLDTDVEENSEENRKITDALYQGDKRHRLMQEMVLGIGGIEILKSIGYKIEKHHMNEGHAAFLALALCKELDVDEVRKKCTFTTHTPVPAGHDKFDKNMAIELLKSYIPNFDVPPLKENEINMTHLGLYFSSYINGVSRKHQEVSQQMFPNYDLKSITNGIHQGFWVCESFKNLFDKYIIKWNRNPNMLRSALNIPDDEIWNAHMQAKQQLVDEINKKTNSGFDPNVFTIGYARRFATYKRAHMILHDIEQLKQISETVGSIQMVFAAKAHPHDGGGKELIKNVINDLNKFKGKVKACFLEDYNIDIAKLMVSGSDIWLNNPKRPMEASGTSGMKAAINGVPNFSTLDGWWLEGCIENITGWSIGLHPGDPGFNEDDNEDDEAADFYKKLREVVLPTYYNDRKKWISIMKHSIALNGSFFNTNRMVQEYVLNAYFR